MSILETRQVLSIHLTCLPPAHAVACLGRRVQEALGLSSTEEESDADHHNPLA